MVCRIRVKLCNIGQWKKTFVVQVEVLSSVVSCITRKIGAQTVIDVGAGQVHNLVSRVSDPRLKYLANQPFTTGVP